VPNKYPDTSNAKATNARFTPVGATHLPKTFSAANPPEADSRGTASAYNIVLFIPISLLDS
jgi:hypothetical protein